MLSAAPRRRPPRARRGARGLTLIEVLLVVCLTALLAGIAYPSYAEQQRRVHRSEALTQLAALQQAQERFRADQPRYGSLADLQLPSSVAGGRYQLEVDETGPSGYRARARALAAQANDQACRVLQVTALRGNLLHASGPDDRLGNDAAANARCWLR